MQLAWTGIVQTLSLFQTLALKTLRVPSLRRMGGRRYLYLLCMFLPYRTPPPAVSETTVHVYLDMFVSVYSFSP